ncbi:FAD-binding domain-containing protein [Thioclava nitratireducens]|uniref:FAD-binding domain-containing protein n=1 Tax=Thioclava nitratireducens TaxID=1915078 RepID=UPI002481789F|nr:FAD-binding domain-containing protein [Thioclava nitratireducens]WGT49593.1 FAD-binding domain-containing protein [Thioclava nitratireducens]
MTAAEPLPCPAATRAAGEERLARFTPRMGAAYAQGRNFDHGAGRHRDVSQLSPYLRRRLVLERDAVARALDAHGAKAAEKFVQEVLWRGYFKGWMEHRPAIWMRYRDGLAHDLATLEDSPKLAALVNDAEAGRSGIACFDAWATELRETGYLHNHARMWFASIWIFTLRLPWRIGADFFYRNLLDGDPASNTLSWRWVAGLHTRGKFYAAEAANIARYTGGRFAPDPAQFAAVSAGLEVQEPEGLPPVAPLRAPRAPQPGLPTALLITEEDCRVEDFDLGALDLRGVATVSASHLRSPRAVAEHVARFERDALADATVRSGISEGRPMGADDLAVLVEWALSLGAKQIVTPFIPVGPLGDWRERADAALGQHGIALCEVNRDWDRAIWPHATAGFFKIKKKLPRILEELDLT